MIRPDRVRRILRKIGIEVQERMASRGYARFSLFTTGGRAYAFFHGTVFGHGSGESLGEAVCRAALAVLPPLEKA